MPGPKYVKDFEFPASAGFTRSGRNDVEVRTHVRQPPQRFARGGPVRRALKPSIEQVVGGTMAAGVGAALYERHKRKQAPKPQPAKPTPRASAVDAMRGTTRRKQEQDAGLAKGGTLRRYAMGGQVNGGNALVQRSKPTTELDKVSGGKSALRPGMQRGGKAGKMRSGKAC